MANRKLDGPYSWVVAMSCCVVYITNFGFQRASGVFYVEIMNVFGAKREEAAWPFSICGAVSSFAGIIGGSMVHFFSPRQVISAGVVLCSVSLILCSFAKDIFWLTISYGVIFGLGISCVSPIVPVILNDYFNKYRSTGNGIALAGGSISFFLLPPLTEYFLEIYGLRGTYLLLAGFTIQTLVAASLLRNRVIKRIHKNMCQKTNKKSEELANESQDQILLLVVSGQVSQTKGGEQTEQEENVVPGRMGEKDYESKEFSEASSEKRFNAQSFARVCTLIKEIIVDPMFLIITSSTVITTYIIVTVGVIIVDYGIDRGLRRETSVLMMPAMAVPELLGRLGFGWVADNPYLQRKHLILMVQILSGVILFLFTFATSRILLFCVAVSFGLISSSALVLFNVLFFDYLGAEKLGLAVGLKSSIAGFAFLLSPRILGIFRDNVGSYNYLFYFLGGASILSGLAWFLEPCAKSKTRNRSQNG